MDLDRDQQSNAIKSTKTFCQSNTQTTMIELYVMKKIAVVHRGKVIIIKYYRLSHDVVS